MSGWRTWTTPGWPSSVSRKTSRSGSTGKVWRSPSPTAPWSTRRTSPLPARKTSRRRPEGEPGPFLWGGIDTILITGLAPVVISESYPTHSEAVNRRPFFFDFLHHFNLLAWRPGTSIGSLSLSCLPVSSAWKGLFIYGLSPRFHPNAGLAAFRCHPFQGLARHLQQGRAEEPGNPVVPAGTLQLGGQKILQRAAT